MCVVQVKVLVNTLHHSLEKEKAKTPGDKQRDRLGEVKAAKVGETLTDLKAALQVVTLGRTLAEIKTETVAKH